MKPICPVFLQVGLLSCAVKSCNRLDPDQVPTKRGNLIWTQSVWHSSKKLIISLSTDLGPKLQCLLKVKQDLS